MIDKKFLNLYGFHSNSLCLNCKNIKSNWIGYVFSNFSYISFQQIILNVKYSKGKRNDLGNK